MGELETKNTRSIKIFRILDLIWSNSHFGSLLLGTHHPQNRISPPTLLLHLLAQGKTKVGR